MKYGIKSLCKNLFSIHHFFQRVITQQQIIFLKVQRQVTHILNCCLCNIREQLKPFQVKPGQQTLSFCIGDIPTSSVQLTNNVLSTNSLQHLLKLTDSSHTRLHPSLKHSLTGVPVRPRVIKKVDVLFFEPKFGCNNRMKRNCFNDPIETFEKKMNMQITTNEITLSRTCNLCHGSGIKIL